VRGARTALDLGCGVGRPALLLAEHGLEVEAIGGSAAGLAVVRRTGQARSIPLGVRQGTADALSSAAGPQSPFGRDKPLLAISASHHRRSMEVVLQAGPSPASCAVGLQPSRPLRASL
jgi:methyltransferase family protein